ncbi:MAG: T9SS type A sorting domain-containing protein [Saprospiraceae bacterium]|nr:T9SS type A sorting domain-containing protein [Saprospiraceae bacterium]
MKRVLILILLLFILPLFISGQAINNSVTFEKRSVFELSGFFSNYSSLFDRNGRPYIYSASAGLGLIIYNISDIYNPIPIDTLPPSNFHNLNVNNVHQDDDYLYLSLGNFQSAGQNAGLAILDVSDPSNISIVSIWYSMTYTQGCAIIRTQGKYAYLGAMEDGIIILDISDKENPIFVSQFQPDPSWPGVANYPPNARGMEIRDDILYLAYDAGGLRLVDISDKQNPVQIAQYVNTDLTTRALPAYNNIRLVGDYAFISVDFCGLEVLDISNPDNIQSIDWFNPWNCNGFSWFGSPGHTNELILADENRILFISGGDSEVLSLDISNPNNVEKIGEYAFVKDSAATWGVDVFENQVVLSFIDNSGIPLFQPFYSDFGGIQLLTWEKGMTTRTKDTHLKNHQLSIFPNPMQETIHIQFVAKQSEEAIIEIYDSKGAQIQRFKTSVIPGENRIEHSTENLHPGIYFLKLIGKDFIYSRKAVKIKNN